MKKIVLIFILAAVLTLLVSGAALAAHQGEPVGGCPEPFELHHIGDHEHDEHAHRHVGSDQDQNGDGYLCVTHVGQEGGIHVHTDNSQPLD